MQTASSLTDRRRIAEKFLGITPDFRFYHDHQLDAACGGRHFMRLPDGTCVPIDRYEEQLAAGSVTCAPVAGCRPVTPAVPATAP